MIARILSPLFAVIAFALPVQAIDIQRVVSPGGIEAWLVEDSSIPFMAMDIWFAGGAALDPEDRRGAVNLMVATLEEGAGDMDAQAFAAAREALAATFGFDGYSEDVVVSAQMLTQNRDEAVALLRAALVEPTFDPAALDRVRAQVLSSIEYDATDPDNIAAQTFNQLAFGTHPFAADAQGTPESVAALTRDDIVAAHRAVLVRDRVSVGVAGDISAAELGPLLDTLLGDLPLADVPLPQPADIAVTGGVTVVDFPVTQSSVFFGHAGIAREDPDFFAAFVMNEVLGGFGYRSRLMEEVREARGLTYGIGSWLSLRRNAAMMQGSFSSSNDLVAEAIDLVQTQWADVAANGITEAELEAAQRYMTGAYPLRFNGNAQIAGIMAGMQADGMPIDYINTRNDNVLAVTTDDIRRVAQRLVDPDALHFVVVGQPEGLETTN